MRKKLRKTLALCAMLACVACLGAFASCTNSSSGDNSPAGSTSPSEGGPSANLTLTNGNASSKNTTTSNGSIHSVSVTNSKGGVIVTDVTQAEYGATVTATVRAKKGYRLQKIYANGVELIFKETEDFCYTAKALMADTDLVFTAKYAENPVINNEYEYVLSSTATQTSYWKMEYTDEGISVRVLVQDANVIQNGRLAVEERDFVEFRICEATTSHTLETANALRCLVTADGTFYLQKCLGADDYAASGYGVDYEYGENFNTETLLCTKSKNYFDGYAVEVFLGYDLFGLTKDKALGNMTFAPAINNSLYTDGKKGAGGIVWESAEVTMDRANVENFFENEYKCQRSNPATWLGVAQDGSVYGRYDSSYENAEYLFLGDDGFASDKWTSFAENVKTATVCSVGFEDARTSDLTKQSALDFAQKIAPKKLLLNVGQNDLLSGASAPTTATRVISILKAYHNALPQASLYWSALLPNAKGYTITNETVKTFASSVDYLTVIDCSDNFVTDTKVRSFYFENGTLTAEGYDAYIAGVSDKLGLSVLNGSTTFGNAEYGYSSSGWTVDTETQVLTLTGRTGNEKKYAYFANVSSTAFEASASFSVSDVYNGDETPSFGLVVANANERLYFYVTETYVEGELMKQELKYTLLVDGETKASGALAIGYQQDGDPLTLSVHKTANGIELYLGEIKAFTVSGSSICASTTKASVGVFSENRKIGVQNATVTE